MAVFCVCHRECIRSNLILEEIASSSDALLLAMTEILNVEQEMHYIAILNGIVFPLSP